MVVKEWNCSAQRVAGLKECEGLKEAVTVDRYPVSDEDSYQRRNGHLFIPFYNIVSFLNYK